MSRQQVDYYRYLASRNWRLKRRQVLARAFHICERCGDAEARQVHHLSYEHIGHEPLEDLQAICRPCHEYVSGEAWHDPLKTVVSRLLADCMVPTPVGPADMVFWWDIGETKMGVRLCVDYEYGLTTLRTEDAYRGDILEVGGHSAYCWWM